MGFKNIPPVSSRIIDFRLRDAIAFSLKRDIRFSIAILSILGFTIWWGIAPEPLLLKPEALISPDIHTLYTVAKDTFINKVCSSHPLISSPCECGEPLNNEAKHLLNTTFDPLGIEKPHARAKALAVYIAAILITVALSESVSIHVEDARKGILKISILFSIRFRSPSLATSMLLFRGGYPC